MSRKRCYKENWLSYVRYFWATVVFLLIAGFFVGVCAQAKTKTKTLMVLKKTENVVVTISYDVERPKVYFLDPSGKVYKESNASQRGMSVEESGKRISYFIMNAEPGKWQVVYDKKGNSQLDVDYGNFVPSLSIQTFKASVKNSGKAKVSFSCSYESDTDYNYELFAVTKENGAVSASKLLKKGTGKTNQKKRISVDLSKLATYDQYYFRLDVYKKVHGIEAQDSQVSSKPFAYHQDNAPAAIKGCAYVVNLSNQTLKVKWSDSQTKAEQYLVGLFYNDDTENAVESQTLGGDCDSTELTLDMEKDSAIVEITYRSNGMMSESLRKEIPLKNNEYQVEMQTEEITNSRQLLIAYDVPKKTELKVEMNDRIKHKHIEGKSSLSFNMNSDINTCSVCWNNGRDVEYLIEREVQVDRIAPEFTLYEEYDGIQTDKKQFEIVGKTEPSASLSVNGKACTVDGSGAFLANVDLEYGDNSLLIQASDAAGNVSQKNINIKRITGNSWIQKMGLDQMSFWMEIVVTFGCMLLLSLTLAMVYGRKMKKKPWSPRKNIRSVRSGMYGMMLAMAAVVEGVLVYQTMSYHDQLTAKGYYETAKAGVDQAYEIHQLYKQYCFISKVFAGICGMLFLLLVISCIMTKYAKDKQNSGKQPMLVHTDRGRLPEKPSQNTEIKPIAPVNVKPAKRENVKTGSEKTPHAQPIQKGKIKATAGSMAGAELELADGEQLVIGRDPATCQLIINHNKVSRKHMAIQYDGKKGIYTITCFSANGVELSNGSRISQNQKMQVIAGIDVILANGREVLHLE